MASEEKIQLMPLGEIKPYEDAPFKVRLDENMEELVESIKENGVLVPTIARPQQWQIKTVLHIVADDAEF